MPDIYNIEEQSEYHIKLMKLENLEDAGEEFITSEELKEMGIDRIYGTGGTKHFDSKITTTLSGILTSIKPGKKSAIIKDEILVDVLKGSHYPVSNWVDGTRRVGNRLFKGAVKVEQSIPTFTDWKSLVTNCVWYLRNTYDVDLSITANHSDRIKTIEMFKATFSWEDLEVDIMDGHEAGSIELKWRKMMWEDTTTIPLVKGSK